MPDEGSFLRAILTNPTDDLPRLVYADWLDEQQTDEASRKAEFIRLQHATGKQYEREQKHKRNRARIRELANDLPVGWLAAVSHAAVEGCDAAGTAIHDWRLRRSLETVAFAFECPKDWAGMTPTDDERVRQCTACGKNVHFCDTVGEARNHAWVGDCVAVNVARSRTPGDLEMPMMAGIIAPDYWDRTEHEKGEGTG
jgi:uncharacterized protein (TIGR02996 family)